MKLPATKVGLVRKYLGKRCADADVCFSKPTKRDSAVVADPTLHDTEQVPLLYPGASTLSWRRKCCRIRPMRFIMLRT